MKTTNRGGRPRIPVGDVVDVTCWCEKPRKNGDPVTKPVPLGWVLDGRTWSCGEGCGP